MSLKTENISLAKPLDIAEGLKFGTADYVVFTVMLSASAFIGVYFGFFAKAKNTTEEYLRGGKKMQTLPIAISLVARCVQIPFNLCYILRIRITVDSHKLELLDYECVLKSNKFYCLDFSMSTKCASENVENYIFIISL